VLDCLLVETVEICQVLTLNSTQENDF